jgi:hypothetical protein
MAEAIGSILLQTALNQALQLGNQRLREAQEVGDNNMVACIAYLEAARAAIRGLEEELDEILVEAKRVASFSQTWENRPDVFKRINEYLNRDRLRPVLDQSIEGIDRCSQAARDDSRRFFVWRQEQREQKAEVVENLLKLLEDLREFLQGLSLRMQLDRENYAGPSGLGMSELLELEKLLDDSKAGAKSEATRREEIWMLVNNMQETRERRGLPLGTQVEVLVRDISVAFRLAAITKPT